MSADLARQIVPATPLRANTAAAARTSVPLFSYENLRRHYDMGFEEKWQICVVEKLIEFTNLPQDWDGYGASPVKWDAGMFALNVLSQVMLPRTPVPKWCHRRSAASNLSGTRMVWISNSMLPRHTTANFGSKTIRQAEVRPPSLRTIFQACKKPSESCLRDDNHWRVRDVVANLGR